MKNKRSAVVVGDKCLGYQASNVACVFLVFLPKSHLHSHVTFFTTSWPVGFLKKYAGFKGAFLKPWMVCQLKCPFQGADLSKTRNLVVAFKANNGQPTLGRVRLCHHW